MKLVAQFFIGVMAEMCILSHGPRYGRDFCAPDYNRLFFTTINFSQNSVFFCGDSNRIS